MSAQALLWQRVQSFNVSACLSSLFLQMFVSRAPRTHNTETWAKKSFRRFVALKSLYVLVDGDEEDLALVHFWCLTAEG